MNDESSVVEGNADQIEDKPVKRGRVRHPWLIAFAVGIVLALVFPALVYQCLEPVYQASALIQIRSSVPYLVFAPEKNDEKTNNKFVQTQIELLRDPLVIESVFSNPEIGQIREISEAENPLEYIAKKVNVNPVGKSELYEVSFECSDPEGAANIINAIVNSYFSVLDKHSNQFMQSTIALLEEEHSRRLKNIVRLREQLWKSAKEAGISPPFLGYGQEQSFGNGTETRESPLDSMKKMLLEKEVSHEILKAKMEACEGEMERPFKVPQSMISAEIEASEHMKELQKQLDEKKLMMIDLEAELSSRLPRGNMNMELSIPHFAGETDIPQIGTKKNNNIIDEIPGLPPVQSSDPNSINIDESWANALKKEMLVQQKSKQKEDKENDAKVRVEKQKYAKQIAALNKDIDKTERKLSRLHQLLTTRVKNKLVVKIAEENREKLAEMQQQLKKSKIELELLKKHYDHMVRIQRENPEVGFDLTFQMAELFRSEDVLNRIANRVTALKTERRAPARVFKRRDAMVPEEYISKAPSTYLAVAALVGLCLPLLVTGFGIAWGKRRCEDG